MGDDHLQSAISKLEAERAEVDDVLSSGVFGRTNNHVRLLTFVCEKYFEGAIDEIKEYSIAVHALGRPESFDPQADTIVRVTAHALRKRLEDYYRTAGAQHAVHICLPPGHYAPKFIHRGALDTPAPVHSRESHTVQSLDTTPPQQNGSLHPQQSDLPPPLPAPTQKDGEQHYASGEPAGTFKFSARKLKTSVVMGVSVCVLGVLAW